ncbi:unnamed protein product [Moneuplotes crassus]|uniref:Uncharacterized protein n=1 Tax=Euplotes crassus TaxID=5936 RepID=A0AAD1X5A2_EUPCR|nr:unnamed protein product [Moneuplotes crassus]
MEKDVATLENNSRVKTRENRYMSIREDHTFLTQNLQIPRKRTTKGIKVSSIEIIHDENDKKNEDLALFDSPPKDPPEDDKADAQAEAEFEKLLSHRKWLHSRKRIKHNKANIRLCQKPPGTSRDGTKAKDFMKELRINQYGQYIQEKLGLFKKPTKLELMLHNYKRGYYSQDQQENDILNSSESLAKITKNHQKQSMSIECPQRLAKASLVKPVQLSSRPHHQRSVGKPTDFSERFLSRDKRSSYDFDEKDSVVSKKYKKTSKEAILKRSLVAYSADKRPRLRLFKNQRNMASTAAESIRERKHFKDPSIIAGDELSSSRVEHKLEKKKSDFLTANEGKHTVRDFSVNNKIKPDCIETRSIQDLCKMLHFSNKNKQTRRIPRKMLKKINTKLINIFRDPSVSSSALESASRRSIDNINILKNSLIEKQEKAKPKRAKKPKETFEAIMKRIMEKGINSSETTPKDDLFKGDNLKLYKFFLNKLLNQSSDTFLCKKHHAFLVHQNMVNSGPNFYERMGHDISTRKNKNLQASITQLRSRQSN